MTTLHFTEALLPEGWRRDVRVVLAGGRVASVTPDVPPGPDDDRHGIAVPGMPNLHSHAFQRAMAGLTETRGAGPDSFWSWRELMYRFAGRMTPEDVEAVAAQLYVEMLEAGFTRVGEFHYLHHAPDGAAYADPAEMAASIAAASAETGLKLTLLPVFYAHSGFGGAAPNAGQRRFINDLDGFSRLLASARQHVAMLPDAVVGIAPHSLRAVTPEELTALLPLAAGGPVHIHIAEQVKEVEDCRAWSGARPVRWLLDHMLVDRRWCLVHATHMDDGEIRDMAASGAVAGLCPVTEANLGDGIFAGAAFREAGGRFGIGSDSNVEIGVAAELRQLEYSQRLEQRGRNVLASPGASTGRSLFDAALTGGAQALGAAMPAIAPGAPADLVTLRADDSAAVAATDDRILDAWIFSAGNRLVDSVWVAGLRQVTNGRHHAAAAIAERFRRTLRRLIA